MKDVSNIVLLLFQTDFIVISMSCFPGSVYVNVVNVYVCDCVADPSAHTGAEAIY